MRIALTIEELDVRRGGAEVGTVRLVRDLTERGHDVHIFTQRVAVELPSGVKIHNIKVPWPTVALQRLAFAKNVARALAKERFDASIACGRPFSEDIVWSQNGTHLANVAGAVRSYYHGPLLQFLRRYQDFYTPKGWVYRWLERSCFARRRPPFVIAVSGMVAREYQHYYGLSADRIATAYYQIDLERFTPERIQALRKPVRTALGLQENTLAVLAVGQNFKRKGIRPLIEAVAQLQSRRKDFCLLIAGGYQGQAAPYEKLVRHLGCSERVRFIGQTQRIEELYAAADVFCLPSFYDTFGMVVLEAMACGRAAIASRYSGAAEIIRHGVNGLILQEPEKPDELVQLIESLFDPALRDRLGSAAIATAQDVCRKNSANDIGKVAEDLAARVREESAQGTSNRVTNAAKESAPADS